LLGRHVFRSPNHQAGAGHHLRGCHPPGNSEVEDLHSLDITTGQIQIAGLKISVDHPPAVCECERGGYLTEQTERIADRQWASTETLTQVLSIEPLHRQEALSIGSRPMRDVGNNAGMLKL
jgi:hypothetical protein